MRGFLRPPGAQKRSAQLLLTRTLTAEKGGEDLLDLSQGQTPQSLQVRAKKASVPAFLSGDETEPSSFGGVRRQQRNREEYGGFWAGTPMHSSHKLRCFVRRR
ncbi:hypothetical protein TGPRC2_234625 [Toxoplasma gondii TgCatPRC2]|uniref:Uncharacterized protein n=4 Tax=Toxoplasma gondii TaxID=5811 RepID=A0A151HQP9_TOXGO|nr:hypothetical protein TGME49_234625 [Toxoplasma gondii ME49]EPT26771.1 hypothetical protein TGME49_234625 [Toxoplasma gondii ME49]KFG45998.1 hypothetical protein TGDOM2_234625 [Toxoplasma gondii GAB2-2007-GAL-DOM2]KYF42363.1 hypothetical protein TGARI_234625 [Toxoplasma gondii ARI]KYK71554.1 hypothetical protein TGPRC2_234625 [Toxoplasma gondii TgCatPRC2]|eukprot:XP_018635849.1 hypothetical protein TGME49_234625 [Toxoplasma gondii ME49]